MLLLLPNYALLTIWKIPLDEKSEGLELLLVTFKDLVDFYFSPYKDTSTFFFGSLIWFCYYFLSGLYAGDIWIMASTILL